MVSRVRSWLNFRHFPDIRLERLRKNTRNISHDNRTPGRKTLLILVKYFILFFFVFLSISALNVIDYLVLDRTIIKELNCAEVLSLTSPLHVIR